MSLQETSVKCQRAQLFSFCLSSFFFTLPLRRGIYNCFPIPFIRGIRRLLNIKAQVSPVRAIGHQIERKMSGLQGCPLFTPDYFFLVNLYIVSFPCASYNFPSGAYRVSK